MLADPVYTRRKGRRKAARVALEVAVLAFLAYLIADAFLTLPSYRPCGPGPGRDAGFIALSYAGIDLTGSSSRLVGRGQLREQLAALKERGYVTVTQDDVVKYYRQGASLPERSLFLLFENGRRDSAIFAQPVLEDLNFKATMLTYAQELGRDDPLFLSPGDLKALLGSTYWEAGSSGYRVSFINVRDRYGNYLGEMDPLRFAMVRSGCDRDYNHFLMDFIRDQDRVPRESVNRMRRRVSYEYERLAEVYERDIGYVPALYMLLHGNTGAFGNNRQVSAVNERWIRGLFALNFNREGLCLNTRDSSPYDLTRMQPQPDWSTNHLLMRVKNDINEPMGFVSGDEAKQADWELLAGASEIRGEEMVLTSLPRGQGLARLKGSADFRDTRVTVAMGGNRYAEQTVFLRSDGDLSRYVAVSLVDDTLLVRERPGPGGPETIIYARPLVTLLGGYVPSVEEDRREVEANNLEAFARYADSPALAAEYLSRAARRRAQPARTVAEGAAPARLATDIASRGGQEVGIDLAGDQLSVTVGPATLGPVTVGVTGPGYLYLCSGWRDTGWSQRLVADDVYDGRFDRLKVADNRGDTLYTLEDTGLALARRRALRAWRRLVRVFVREVSEEG